MASTEPSHRLTSAQQRRARLLACVQEQGFCTIAELSAAFGVSEMTIRRDVRLLVHDERMRSVHGGVTMLPASAMDGTDFRARTGRMREVKRSIARRAVEYLPPRGAIALDAGTTVLEVANALPASTRLDVVTASLPTMNVLLGKENLEVIGLGGTLHHNSQSFAGPATIAAIGELRVRTLFLAASGLTLEGVYCGNHFDAVTKRALVDIADEVVLVADSSKFDISAMVRACSFDDVDVIVTDDGISPEARQALSEHEVDTVIVPADADHRIA